MNKYGNLIVIPGKVKKERLSFFENLCLDDAKNMFIRRPSEDMPTFEQLSNYRFFADYEVLSDETRVGWVAEY